MNPRRRTNRNNLYGQRASDCTNISSLVRSLTWQALYLPKLRSWVRSSALTYWRHTNQQNKSVYVLILCSARVIHTTGLYCCTAIEATPDSIPSGVVCVHGRRMFVLGYFLFDSVKYCALRLGIEWLQFTCFAVRVTFLMGYLLRDITKEFVSHLRDVSSDC